MTLRILYASFAFVLLSGCASLHNVDHARYTFPGESRSSIGIAGQIIHGDPGTTEATVLTGWDTSIVHQTASTDWQITDAYLLDTGDRLRIFVYGQPNLSRLYTIDHDGNITVPLIGTLPARALTTSELQREIRHKLGSSFVRDPQVTVDVQQNRPFFILGEVRAAGKYPYVSGMTVETAVAIAGGYSERASTRSFRVTRRSNPENVEQMDVPSGFTVKPGDTIFVYERFF